MDVPLEILDRQVARAARTAAKARAALLRGEGSADNPLEAARRVSSRAALLELGEIAEGRMEPGLSKHLLLPDPIPVAASMTRVSDDGDPRVRHAAGLRAWVYALTLERVLWADLARLAAAWNAPSITIERGPDAGLGLSPRALVHRLIAEPDDGRRRLWADELARGAGPSADAARAYAERRAEAARLLEMEPDAVEIPADPPAIAAAAEALLAATEPFVERRVGHWADAIGASVGRAFGEGWPARLVPRWVADQFRGTPLTEGLAIAPITLPAPLGASSFARALAAFGAAVADADGPSSAPFALAHPPFDPRRARRAALLGALAADPIFGARALGLGRDRAREQARGVARALLVSLRLDAARVLCRGALLLPARDRANHFEERTAAALGAPIPPALAGIVPRLGPDDPSRFAGALLAARDRRELVDRFDEDWFRSPHAAEAIREEDGVLPAHRRASAEALGAGVAAIVRSLEELG